MSQQQRSSTTLQQSVEQENQPGFILTRQWIDKDPGEGTQLRFWVKTAKEALLVLIDGTEPVFFIHSEQQARVATLLKGVLPDDGFRFKSVAMECFKGQPVSAVYFATQGFLYQARRVLYANMIEVFEGDINPTDRFLMERFITGGVLIESSHLKNDTVISNPKLVPAEFKPEFTVVSLDIETSIYGDQLFSIGLSFSSTESPDKTEDYVILLNNPNYRDKHQAQRLDYVSYVDTESELISECIRLFERYDPDIIIGWAVINFDLRFLQRRADQLNIPLTLGRRGAPITWRQSRDDANHYTLTVPGRLVLDGIETLKSATHQFESFSLEFVSRQVLGEGKAISKVTDRGQEIMRLYARDHEALARYNLQDCQLVWRIFQSLDLLSFAVARSQLTGLAMDRFGGSVAAFDNRYLPRLHRHRRVAPMLQSDPVGVGSPGGYVMESIPNIYQHVLLLDFKSLYPSIIQTFKVDPLSLSSAMLQSGMEASASEFKAGTGESKVIDPERWVAGYDGGVFDKKLNILPDLIAELSQARESAKASNNQALSQAIKILMNSFYGVLGTGGCRFFDPRLPRSITQRGHFILETTAKQIEAKGYKVIYGDTDSVFIWLQGYHSNINPETLHHLGQQLANELNQWWREYLKHHYQLVSYLELEFESHFKQFVMPTIRGSKKGTKKRYAGLKTQVNGSEQLIFKGLEAVRSDWTKAARDFQTSLYQKVLTQQPYDALVIDTIKRIENGELDSKLIYKKKLRRPLDDYRKQIPPHVQAARAAEASRKEDNLPPFYRRGAWIEYVLTTKGPQAVGYINAPLDYQLYIKRQIEPIVDGILHFMDDSFDNITSKQQSLF